MKPIFKLCILLAAVAASCSKPASQLVMPTETEKVATEVSDNRLAEKTTVTWPVKQNYSCMSSTAPTTRTFSFYVGTAFKLDISNGSVPVKYRIRDAGGYIYKNWTNVSAGAHPSAISVGTAALSTTIYVDILKQTSTGGTATGYVNLVP